MEHSMEKASTKMRNLVIAVGGPLEAGENRKAWLSRVAAAAGLSFRVVSAAWHGEQLSANTRQKLRIAAGKYEAQTLARRFEGLAESLRHRDPDFHMADIAAIVDAARVLRRMGGAGTDGG